LPGFTALGPVLTTTDEIPDPATLHLTTRLNDTVVQSADVSDLIFPIAEVIAYLSRWYTFLPGDVLLTGTPAGVGVGRKPPLFIKKNDVLNVEIDRIGRAGGIVVRRVRARRVPVTQVRPQVLDRILHLAQRSERLRAESDEAGDVSEHE